MSSPSIAIIGAGHMGCSLIAGLASHHYPAHAIFAASPRLSTMQTLKDAYGINITTDNSYAAQQAEVIILAVKPTAIKSVSMELKNDLPQKPLIISIAAGITTEYIASLLGHTTALIRAMPNTPALIGKAATVLFANQETSEAQRNMAEHIFNSIGMTAWVDNEALLNAVTALSGSGPAYFYYFMEAMIKGGIALGLPPHLAKWLTLQTGLGATLMALQAKKDLATLRQEVTSKGGTTESALKTLENMNVAQHIQLAIKNACERAEELATSNVTNSR